MYQGSPDVRARVRMAYSETILALHQLARDGHALPAAAVVRVDISDGVSAEFSFPIPPLPREQERRSTATQLTA